MVYCAVEGVAFSFCLWLKSKLKCDHPTKAVEQYFCFGVAAGLKNGSFFSFS